MSVFGSTLTLTYEKYVKWVKHRLWIDTHGHAFTLAHIAQVKVSIIFESVYNRYRHVVDKKDTAVCIVFYTHTHTLHTANKMFSTTPSSSLSVVFCLTQMLHLLHSKNTCSAMMALQCDGTAQRCEHDDDRRRCFSGLALRRLDLYRR